MNMHIRRHAQECSQHLDIIGNTRNNNKYLPIVVQTFKKQYIQIIGKKWYLQKSGIFTTLNNIDKSHRHIIT